MKLVLIHWDRWTTSKCICLHMQVVVNKSMSSNPYLSLIRVRLKRRFLILKLFLVSQFLYRLIILNSRIKWYFAFGRASADKIFIPLFWKQLEFLHFIIITQLIIFFIMSKKTFYPNRCSALFQGPTVNHGQKAGRTMVQAWVGP